MAVTIPTTETLASVRRPAVPTRVGSRRGAARKHGPNRPPLPPAMPTEASAAAPAPVPTSAGASPVRQTRADYGTYEPRLVSGSYVRGFTCDGEDDVGSIGFKTAATIAIAITMAAAVPARAPASLPSIAPITAPTATPTPAPASAITLTPLTIGRSYRGADNRVADAGAGGARTYITVFGCPGGARQKRGAGRTGATHPEPAPQTAWLSPQPLCGTNETKRQDTGPARLTKRPDGRTKPGQARVGHFPAGSERAERGSGARDVRGHGSRPPRNPKGAGPSLERKLAATIGNTGSTPDCGEPEHRHPKEERKAGRRGAARERNFI